MNRNQDKREWFKEAIERFERPLVAYVLRKTQDLERARELVQETFLRLWQQDPGQVEDHLAQWLFTVCRNLWIDSGRKERHMKAVKNDQLAKEPDAGPLPNELMEKNQEHHRVISLVSRLPEKQQEVLRLKFQHGMSYREISKITGLSESNVGFLIHEGISQLREKLGS